MDIELPEGLGDSAMLSLIVGFVAPLVYNFLINANWKPWVKALMAFLFSAILGLAVALVAGAFDGLSILSSILLVFVVAITTYQNFWTKVAPKMQEQVGLGSHSTPPIRMDETKGTEFRPHD